MSSQTYWQFNPVYSAFIQALTKNFDLQRYTVYFSVIALSANHPRAFVRITVKDLETGTTKQRDINVRGTTIQRLEEELYEAIKFVVNCYC